MCHLHHKHLTPMAGIMQEAHRCPSWRARSLGVHPVSDKTPMWLTVPLCTWPWHLLSSLASLPMLTWDPDQGTRGACIPRQPYTGGARDEGSLCSSSSSSGSPFSGRLLSWMNACIGWFQVSQLRFWCMLTPLCDGTGTAVTGNAFCWWSQNTDRER